MKAIKNILVPVDFSDNSKAAYADFVTVVTKYRSFWQRFTPIFMTKILLFIHMHNQNRYIRIHG